MLFTFIILWTNRKRVHRSLGDLQTPSWKPLTSSTPEFHTWMCRYLHSWNLCSPTSMLQAYQTFPSNNSQFSIYANYPEPQCLLCTFSASLLRGHLWWLLLESRVGWLFDGCRLEALFLALCLRPQVFWGREFGGSVTLMCWALQCWAGAKVLRCSHSAKPYIIIRTYELTCEWEVICK